MTSDSILNTTILPSYRMMSDVCLAVFSVPWVRWGPRCRLSAAHTKQALLKCLLVLGRFVGNLAGVVIVVAGGRMWVGVVFGEDAGAVLDGEDEDGLNAEERKGTRHGEGRYMGGSLCRGRALRPPPRWIGVRCGAEPQPITGVPPAVLAGGDTSILESLLPNTHAADDLDVKWQPFHSTTRPSCTNSHGLRWRRRPAHRRPFLRRVGSAPLLPWPPTNGRLHHAQPMLRTPARSRSSARKE